MNLATGGFLERAGTASKTRGRGGGVGFDATLGGREPMTWRPATTVWCPPTLFLDQCTMDTAGTDKLYQAWCLESICAPRKLALRGGCQEIWGTVSLDGTARCDWRRAGVVVRLVFVCRWSRVLGRRNTTNRPSRGRKKVRGNATRGRRERAQRRWMGSLADMEGGWVFATRMFPEDGRV